MGNATRTGAGAAACQISVRPLASVNNCTSPHLFRIVGSVPGDEARLTPTPRARRSSRPLLDGQARMQSDGGSRVAGHELALGLRARDGVAGGPRGPAVRSAVTLH